MKNKRKFILVVIVICIGILSLVRACSANENQTKEQSCLTRYEWIEMLTERFGITEYVSEEPYYEDVDVDNTYFKSIQSAVEWNILNKEQEFQGEEPATGEFIALTSMRAIGKCKVQIYIGTTDEILDEDYLDIALEKDLVKKSQMKKTVTKEEGVIILLKAIELYQNMLWKDDVSEIKYQQQVLQIEHDKIVNINEECTQVELKNKSASLKVDDVVIVELPGSKEKLAKKIKEISGENILTLEDADLQEVIDSVMVSDIVSVSAKDVVSYYNQLSKNETFERNETGANDYQALPVVGVNWEGEEFKIRLEVEEEELTVSINGLIVEKYDVKGKFKNGTISTELSINDLCVGMQFIASGEEGVEGFNIQTQANIDIEGEIAIEKSKDFKIPLFKAPIVLAGGCVTVNLEFYLVLAMDGSVKVEAGIPARCSIDYRKGQGICSPKLYVGIEEPEIVTDCTISLFIRNEVVPQILGIQIIDAEADFGIKGTGSITTRTGNDILFCADVSIAAPIVTLSISADDEKNTLVNISGEWEIMNEDNAWYKSLFHAEMYKDGKMEKVEECTYNVSEIDTSAPHTYVAYFNSSFVDKGDYYEVTGRLTDRVYIPASIVKNMSANDKYYYDGVEFIFKDKEYSEYDKTERFCNFTDKQGNKYVVDLFNWHGNDSEQYHDIETVQGELSHKKTWTFVVIDDNYKFKIRKNKMVSLIMGWIEDEHGGKSSIMEQFSVEQIYNEGIKDYMGNIFTETQNISVDITFDEDGYMTSVGYDIGYGEITFIELK